MSLLAQKIIDSYNYLYEPGDPRMQGYFLLDSPVLLLAILVFYYLFCTKLGPQFMKGRVPFTLEIPMMAYNLSQVIMNSIFVYKAITVVWIPNHYKLVCQVPGYGPSDDIVARNTYLFLVCRLCDLFDTVFMVFRKKYKQVTFLHIYHHIMVCCICWYVAKYIPGGHTIVFGTLNSFVHAIMYAYYFITAVYPESKGSMWWKRHITEIQLVQFILIGVQNSIALLTPSCEYPRFLIVLYLSQAFIMFYLFSKFYYKCYLKPNVKKNK